MTPTAYNLPPQGSRLSSTSTRDTYLSAIASYGATAMEIGDLDAPVIAVPARELDPCEACVEDADAGHWPPTESVVAVTWVVRGYRHVRDCCVHHVRYYAAEAARTGAPVVVEVPVLPAADTEGVAA